jgi:hypothetical protein
MLRTGLSLACLPTALAVYREVRDSYKAFILADLVVSWPTLLSARYSIFFLSFLPLLGPGWLKNRKRSKESESDIALIILWNSIFPKFLNYFSFWLTIFTVILSSHRRNGNIF